MIDRSRASGTGDSSPTDIAMTSASSRSARADSASASWIHSARSSPSRLATEVKNPRPGHPTPRVLIRARLHRLACQRHSVARLLKDRNCGSDHSRPRADINVGRLHALELRQGVARRLVIRIDDVKCYARVARLRTGRKLPRPRRLASIECREVRSRSLQPSGQRMKIGRLGYGIRGGPRLGRCRCGFSQALRQLALLCSGCGNDGPRGSDDAPAVVHLSQLHEGLSRQSPCHSILRACQFSACSVVKGHSSEIAQSRCPLRHGKLL